MLFGSKMYSLAPHLSTFSSWSVRAGGRHRRQAQPTSARQHLGASCLCFCSAVTILSCLCRERAVEQGADSRQATKVGTHASWKQGFYIPVS